MKYKSILSLFIFLLGFGVSTTSCEDMLTPDMDRYSEGFSGNDTVYFYLGILRNVQDMVEQNDNNLDGVINNLRSPKPAAQMTDEDVIETEQKKKSVLEKIRETVPNDDKARSVSLCPDRELC